jgi:hypothetical protein
MEADRAGRRSKRRTSDNGNSDAKHATQMRARLTIDLSEQEFIDFVNGKPLVFEPGRNLEWHDHGMEGNTDGDSRP